MAANAAVAALKGKCYCYFHFRVHAIVRRSAAPTAPYEQKELEMPFLEDRGAVQIALSEVVTLSPENGSTTNAPDSSSTRCR